MFYPSYVFRIFINMTRITGLTLIQKMYFFIFSQKKIVTIFEPKFNTKNKRKMKKIALIALLALPLAACFNSGNDSSSSNDCKDIIPVNNGGNQGKSDNGKSGIAVRPSEQQETVEPAAEQPAYENDGKVIELTDETFNSLCIEMETNDIICPVPFIIDYNATWCGPCRQLAPVLAKLQKEYGNKMQVFSVDIDKCQEAASMFEFDAIPTMIFVDADGNWEQITGGLPESELRKAIKKHLKLD